VVHPYANASRLGAYLSYRQVQIVQTDYDRVEIRYVPDDVSRAPDVAEIENLIRQIMLDPGISVSLVSLDRFEPSPGGKFEETVSLVAGAGPAVQRAENA
jgi:hypothetical protein